MKASVSPAATARVLARIDRATSDTAAAVERVLQTATPGLTEPSWGYDVSREICDDLGIEHADDVERCGARRCPYCWGDSDEADEISPEGLPGLVVYFDARPALTEQQLRYTPEVVSPHLAGPPLAPPKMWQAKIAAQIADQLRSREAAILYGEPEASQGFRGLPIQGQSVDIIIWDDLPPEAS